METRELDELAARALSFSGGRGRRPVDILRQRDILQMQHGFGDELGLATSYCYKAVDEDTQRERFVLDGVESIKEGSITASCCCRVWPLIMCSLR